MEIIKQELLAMGARYWTHHMVRVATEVALSVAMFSGVVTTAVTVGPIHHKPGARKPVIVAVIPVPVTKPVVKHTAPAPAAPPETPAASPAPAQVAVTPAPSPQPIAPSQPSPGSGVKQLVPSAPASSPPPTQPAQPAPSGGPSSASSAAPTAPAPTSGGYYSTNWAGYAALSGTFTSVSGSWTVPAVTGNGSSTSGDAAWIGIGGVGTNDLIQTGTSNMVAADGSVSTFAFYELLPDAALEITSMPVRSGDTMTASIDELPSGKWKISITDTTTGQNYTTIVDYTSSYSSAEWIEEDPSYLDGSLVPFVSFDHVEFTSGSATMNGTSTSLTGGNAAPITLVDSANNPIVTPSVLISSGTSFWALHN